MKTCESCSRSCLPDGLQIGTGSDSNSPILDSDLSRGGDSTSIKLHEQDEQIRRLELELAQTKLALVESQCRNQDLTHQLAANQQEQQKNTWFKKTITTIKEATRNPNQPTNHQPPSNMMLRRETSRDSATGNSS